MKEILTSAANTNNLAVFAGRRSQAAVLPFLVLASVVLVSRLPFLSYGYGFDADAWLIALSAQRIAVTGEYVASRLPGYPVPEFAYALMFDAGPWAFNAVTALLSVAAAILFARCVQIYSSRDYIVAGLAFAFTPVIYINSLNAMDYMWALVFVLGSLYAVLTRRPLIAGALLGLAIGSRISTGAMLVPLSLLLLRPGDGRAKVKPLVQLWLTALGMAGLVFAPVLLKYGNAFFTVYESPFTLLDALSRATVGLWGEVGLAVIAASLAYTLLRRRTEAQRERAIPPVGRLTLAVWIAAILIYLLAYARLPLEAGYLIPAVPFSLLLLGRVLSRRLFLVVCVALLVAPFLFNLSMPTYLDPATFSPYWGSFALFGEQVAVDFLYGPLIYDHLSRVAGLKLVDEIQDFGARAACKTVIVAGSWLPKIEMPLGGVQQGQTTYEFLLDVSEARAYAQRGYHLYYMPGLEDVGMDQFGLNLVEVLSGRQAPKPCTAE